MIEKISVAKSLAKFDALLIAGPTTSGKSALALGLAEKLGGVVLNADSMQVYRELHVLSARPSAADEARAPHRLYGHVPVTEAYSAGRYAADMIEALKDTKREGKLPVITGGTGLYFAALTEGLSPMPSVPAEIREKITSRHALLGAEEFFAEFARHDPQAALHLRASDTQRVLRAASVWEATGRSLKEWQSVAGAPLIAPSRIARFVVAPPREIIASRIDARFLAMMEEGALEEARALMGLDPAKPAIKALGVRPLQSFLRGEITREDAISRAQAETRQFAKRQMTWARGRMSDWTWLEDTDLSNNIARIIVSMT